MRSYLLFALVLVGFHAAFAQVVRADALSFYNNWFLTGDYTVAGTGLKTTGGIGTINMTGVPCTSGVGPSATIVACTVSGAMPAYPVAAFLYWQTVENTSTAAGANGHFNGYPIVGKLLGSDSSSACWLTVPSQTLRAYRADVLRDLPIDPITHLRLANGTHKVALGGVSGVLVTEGASLVVIYRVVVPGDPSIMPLRSVVIYDGVFTLSDKQPSMTQTISGFYQASSTNPAATMTHIVGNGQVGFREQLKVQGDSPGAKSGNRPFEGAQGANWDNLTFGFGLDVNASSTETTSKELTSDCLSWSAIVTSTNVQDSDNDGLLDVWEQGGMHRNTQVSPATFGRCADYPLEPCVNLPAMGAINGVRDVFLQMDWMHGFGDNTGGDGLGAAGHHSHIPKLDALTMVTKAFAAHNIALHFDVGNNYQGRGLPYIIPYKTDSFGNLLAQGGSDLDENTLVCRDTLSHTCDYHELFPVLSFKFGLASVRDGNSLLNIPRHFAQIRNDIFHYVLWAHALAGPYNSAGTPVNADGTPAAHPNSTSGIGDRPGGDLMVTLGLWRSDIPANDQVGSALVQAGTLMHEFGHNLDLSHAGWFTAPNCMPNYPSVMSYLYQTRGLTDVNGVGQIDYSNGLLAGLNENSLSAGASLGPLPYRVRFYGPYNPLINSAGQLAQRHCDGTLITDGALEVRLEGPTVSTPDWSNGTVPFVLPLDVNFDGVKGQTFSDQPDWSSLNLQQIGGRPNFGAWSVGVSAVDSGVSAVDIGVSAVDTGVSAVDSGVSAVDSGVSAVDSGVSAVDSGQDEDYHTHILTTTDGIPTPQQCSGCGLKAVNGLSAITLSWTPPDTGGSLTYNIYRCAGAGCNPSAAASKINPSPLVPPSPSAPTFTDTVNDFVHAGVTCPSTATCYNTTYTYSVTAVSTALVESPYSNPASSEVTHLFVIATITPAAVVYGSANPVPTINVYGDVKSSLDLSQVHCAYSTAPPINVGIYPIACSGPQTTSATDGVTYNAAYLTNTPGSLTISPRPIAVTAAASSKTYDGLTTSTATPAITSGSLAYADSVTWTESYDSRNAGANHVMTPSGSVNDGNGGKNYTVTPVTINTGVILKAPLTITADNQSVGDDSPTPPFTVTYKTLLGTDTPASLTGTLVCTTTRNANSPLGNYPITCSGQSSTNYTIAYVPGILTVFLN